MATLENRHLIDLIIEANVDWPEDAEYAAQDKCNLKVHFYSGEKPTRPRDWDEWKVGNGRIISRFQLQSLCYNWHQTLVTKEQYKQALAARCTVKPTKPRDWDEWKVGNGHIVSRFQLQSLCYNWHQTLVTKEQYKQALAIRCMVKPVNTQAETKSTVTSLTLEELLANYQRYQQLTAEALQALQNKGKQLGLVITVIEPK